MRSRITAVLAIAWLGTGLISDATRAQTGGSNTGIDCAGIKATSIIRPGPQDQRVNVAVGLYVVDVIAIDDVAQAFTAHFLVEMAWRDERLTAEILRACKLNAKDIWHPVIAFPERRQLEKLNENLTFGDDHQVILRQRFMGQFAARFDLRDFPQDTQTLRIRIPAVAETLDSVRFEVAEDAVGRSETFSVAGWELDDGAVSVGTFAVAFRDVELQSVDYTIEARRHVGYYMWKVVVPMILIVLMAWVVFWIDPAEMRPRIGVSTASVLTLIAFQLSLGYLLPRISYLTRMDLFLMGATALVFLGLAETVITGALAAKGRTELTRRIYVQTRWVFVSILAALILWFV